MKNKKNRATSLSTGDCDSINTALRSMRRFREMFVIGGYTIQPQIIHVNRLTGNQRTSALHAHRTFEFSVVLDGGMTYHAGGCDIVCGPGDGIIIPADMRHGWSVSGQFAVVFGFMLFISHRGGGADTFRENTVRRNYFLGRNPSTGGVIDRIISAVRERPPYLDETVLCLSRESYLELFKTLVPEQTPSAGVNDRTTPRNDDSRNIVEAINFSIHDNMHRHIRPIEISRYVGLSLNRINTLLKDRHQLPLGQMIIDKKISFACALLSDTNQQINEIAHAIGMTDIGYFCRMFRKKKGVSPTDYRMKNRSNGAHG
ncbi:MAG: AraC family transcriptional regulator [Spirochaetota bacterium]